MTSFSLAYCAGGIPAGRLTRRLGAGRVLVLGMLLAGGAAVGCAAVASIPCSSRSASSSASRRPSC